MWTWLQTPENMREAARQPQYVELFRRYRRHVDYWEEHFSDDASAITGWLHHYLCPECSSKLIYHPDKPTEHICPTCGRAAPNTVDILEAWHYCRRNDIIKCLYEAAVLYVIDQENKDYEFIVNVISRYAEIYEEFPVHGDHAGYGRIMGQSLDEAVWAVDAMRALLMIGFDGKSELGQQWYHALFLPISKLVLEQSNIIHNIHLWHAACAFGAGLFFGDNELADQAFSCEWGVKNQVLKGFTDDGIWYENSTGYHFYSAQAAMNACLFARSAGLTDQYQVLFDRVIRAYTAPIMLRFRTGELPAFNDSSKEGSDHAIESRLNDLIEAAKVFEGVSGSDAINQVLAEYDTSSSVATLLYGLSQSKAETRCSSINLTHNCLALLRSESMEVFAKYGNIVRSHAHADALEISIPPFSFDPGNPNYGSHLYRGWYTQTAAHNTFVINMESQNPVSHGTAELSCNGTCLEMQVGDAYPGVNASRKLMLQDDTLHDHMYITCENESIIDWVFHSTGKMETDCTARIACEPLSSQAPYSYLQNIAQLDSLRKLIFTQGGRSLVLSFEKLPENCEIFTALSPGNPAHDQRNSVIIRTKGTNLEVAVTYTLT